MNQKKILNTFLIISLAITTIIAILSIGVLLDGEYNIFGMEISETGLTVLIVASMFIAMLSISGLIYCFKKNTSNN